jgi:hypothetical protein
MPGTHNRKTMKKHHLPAKTVVATLKNLAKAAESAEKSAKKAAELAHNVAVRKALTQGGTRRKNRNRKNRH